MHKSSINLYNEEKFVKYGIDKYFPSSKDLLLKMSSTIPLITMSFNRLMEHDNIKNMDINNESTFNSFYYISFLVYSAAYIYPSYTEKDESELIDDCFITITDGDRRLCDKELFLHIGNHLYASGAELSSIIKGDSKRMNIGQFKNLKKFVDILWARLDEQNMIDISRRKRSTDEFKDAVFG